MNCGLALFVVSCCVAMVLSATTATSTTTQSPIHLPCITDAECVDVVCTNLGEVPECHTSASSPTGAECHCHIPEKECVVNEDCVLECGPDATCDKNACHGDCIHV